MATHLYFVRYVGKTNLHNGGLIMQLEQFFFLSIFVMFTLFFSTLCTAMTVIKCIIVIMRTDEFE